MVSPSCPTPADTGGRQRIFQSVRCLASRDEITLCTLYESVDQRDALSSLSALGVQVVPVRHQVGLGQALLKGLVRGEPVHVARYYSSVLREEVARQVRLGQFDVLYAHLLWVAPCIPRASITMVLDLQNLDDEMWVEVAKEAGNPLVRSLATVNARAWKRVQASELGRFDVLLSPSPIEAEVLRSRMGHSQRIWIVPNGVTEVPPRGPRGIAQGGHGVLFCGAMHVRMNEEAAFWMVREVWPRVRRIVADAELWVVGGHPRGGLRALDGSNGVHVTGWVEDVAPYYRRATVAVVPLRRGGGTKLKTLEAMNYGVPCVSTEVGIRGLGIEPGVHALVADLPDDFAALVVTMLESPTRGAELATAARKLVQGHYRWDVIYSELRQRLAGLVERRTYPELD
jgi:glycosyltransferase involved in cell wall biosynthesis